MRNVFVGQPIFASARATVAQSPRSHHRRHHTHAQHSKHTRSRAAVITHNNDPGARTHDEPEYTHDRLNHACTRDCVTDEHHRLVPHTHTTSTCERQQNRDTHIIFTNFITHHIHQSYSQIISMHDDIFYKNILYDFRLYSYISIPRLPQYTSFLHTRLFHTSAFLRIL